MALSNSILKKLQKIVGKEHLTAEMEELVCYSYDATGRRYLPDAVVFPENDIEIAALLRLANHENVFVIPRGAGSGMTGGSLPVKGGIVLVMKRLNRILEIDKDNFIARVQPGVVTGHLHKAVEAESLFYPPDPASSDFSTIGGNLAECAGGPRAVKYGVTRDYVLGLEAVLPTGDIIRTGVQTVKGVVGYDLTRLLVGSEGTLGIITSVTLRLLPLPESIGTIAVVFDRMEDAAQTVSEIIRRGIVPRTIEYMDNASITCTERYLGIGLPVDAGAMLIIEVDGKESETRAELEILNTLCMQQGARTINAAETSEERRDLWKARKSISPALYKFAPDKINEDIVVPRSRIPDMVKKISELKEQSGLIMASFGHAGDGNIHFNIMLDRRNKDDLKKAEAAVEAVFEYTLVLGGTISGEHGIGITKSAFIAKEVGQTELGLMKQIKRVFDPNGILNPGKLFPAG